MKLYLDTTDRDKRFFEIDGERFDVEGDIISEIVKELKKRGKKLKDLTEVGVNPGPGSFTGLRVGFSIANTLNYFLGLKKIDKLPLPNYGKEPNITKPKEKAPED
jgi:hypothetical protein